MLSLCRKDSFSSALYYVLNRTRKPLTNNHPFGFFSDFAVSDRDKSITVLRVELVVSYFAVRREIFKKNCLLISRFNDVCVYSFRLVIYHELLNPLSKHTAKGMNIKPPRKYPVLQNI